MNDVLNYESGPKSDDHSLGKAHDNYGYDATSPILGFYAEDHATVGECDHWESPDVRSHTLSDCTYGALKLSREHHQTGHADY